MASKRLKVLIQGLYDVLGEEEVLQIMTNQLVAEEISSASQKYNMNEIESAIADAKERECSRWAWVAMRLERGPNKTENKNDGE
ncbi:MAG: hypothetical protein JKX97_08490 [Candidatus Lindowbacteria bacterium]|nr:hypothetical protein [Candidatus Lindowbacteria bacterium]